LNSKFVSFRFCLSYFLAVVERIVSSFALDHCDVQIKRNVSFRYRNELKIGPKNELVLCTLTSLTGMG
jgi:hypothetical protein